MAAKKASKGKVIRISEELHDHLREKWNQNTASWDDFLRHILGIKRRRKQFQNPTLTIWYLKETNRGFRTLADARGEAVMNAARARRKDVEEPVKLREIP